MSEAQAKASIGQRVIWAPPELQQPPWRGKLLDVKHGAAVIQFDGQPRTVLWPYLRDLAIDSALTGTGGTTT
jgi:hypothetical protein